MKQQSVINVYGRIITHKGMESSLSSKRLANTCFAYNELVDYIGTTYQLVGAVSLGYADEAPVARPRKCLDDVVEYR